MKSSLIQVIHEAGFLVLKHYGDNHYDSKDDNSPITKADKSSHDFLSMMLPKIKDIPVLSEESFFSYEARKNWQSFWLIDPLDGTKEFINKLDDFCINIALIENNRPILGIIYAPALNELYWAAEKQGYEYYGKANQRSQDQGLVTAISRFHNTELTTQFMQLNGLSITSTVGAAIKFCHLAVGKIDLYPRFEGSKEWDTAAGQIILTESGGAIIDINTNSLPLYNKPNIANNYFIACRAGLDIKQFHIPRLS